MQYNESNYAEEERAAFQRGDVALAGLLAACDAYAQDGAAMARECELVHDTLAESIAALAELKAAVTRCAEELDDERGYVQRYGDGDYDCDVLRTVVKTLYKVAA